MDIFKEHVSKALHLVAKFSRSTVGTSNLTEKTGKRLISYCRTRWNTVYFVLERLLELKDAVNSVCIELDFEVLQPTTWKILASLKELLQHFAFFSEEISSQTGVTISLIIPRYTVLQQRLKLVGTIFSQISTLATFVLVYVLYILYRSLLSCLRRRIWYQLSSDVDFHSLSILIMKSLIQFTRSGCFWIPVSVLSYFCRNIHHWKL